MKKDIEIPKVEGVGIAIMKEVIAGEESFKAHIINFNSYKITNVLISTKGYGRINDKEIKTSKFNHFIGDVNFESHKPIEVMSEEVFGLNNEFFVTYYIGKIIYDKKYIFVPESINEKNFIDITILNNKGVLIR